MRMTLLFLGADLSWGEDLLQRELNNPGSRIVAQTSATPLVPLTRRRYARQSGCVSEPRRVQEGLDFRIDGLFLLIADYASPAQAVGFYRHQSRQGRVFDWKDYVDVQLAVLCGVTERKVSD